MDKLTDSDVSAFAALMNALPRAERLRKLGNLVLLLEEHASAEGDHHVVDVLHAAFARVDGGKLS